MRRAVILALLCSSCTGVFDRADAWFAEAADAETGTDTDTDTDTDGRGHCYTPGPYDTSTYAPDMGDGDSDDVP